MEYPESDSWVAHLVLTLLLDESLASACLSRLGITRDWLIAGTLGKEVAISAAKDSHSDDAVYFGDACTPAKPLDALNDPLSFSRVLDRAAEISRRSLSDGGVTSVHLLLAILETSDVVRDALEAEGATVQKIRDELQPVTVVDERPLPVDEPIVFAETHHLMPTDSVAVDVAAASMALSAGSSVWRVLDANLNRSREALRVLDDFARFIADDESCCAELKSMRHELVQAELLLRRIAMQRGAGEVLSHRDASGDVGTSITVPGERQRDSVADLVLANCRRLQESLRSLEEFGKLASPEFGATAKQLRYRSYVIEQTMMPRATAEAAAQGLSENARRLQSAHLYVLMTESLCRLPWKQVVEESLAGGADVIQLREKHLNDREILERARWIREACHSAGALFVMNDRADLAVACDADGVHVGQDELTVEQCRQLLQPWQLVGVSTHDVSQIQSAMLAGADYIGVGPVFPSKTKSFGQFPGLEFVAQATVAASRPWFAIGGISLENVGDVKAQGCRRIAVTSAVLSSTDPRQVVEQLRRAMLGT